MELSVETASGAVFEVDHCVQASVGYMTVLYIEFMGYSMTDIFPVFANAEETATIKGYVGEELSKTYEGYTKLAEIFIVPGTDDHVRIRLEQEQHLEALGENS